MNDLLMFAFVILFIAYFVLLYFKCEKLIDEIIKFKALKAEKSVSVSWMTGGFLLLFHINELFSIKK